MLSVVGIVYVDAAYGKHQWAYRLVADSNAVLAVMTSVAAFMYFKNLKMRHHKWINTIAASTFGVLMIHANSDTMRQWLWQDIIGCVRHYASPYACLYAVAAVIIIFSVCILIDYLRIHTLERWTFRWIDRRIGEK